MADYSDYVQCGEVYRSSIISSGKPYLFKCIKCREFLQLEAFLIHFQQNLCELREITIKEEVLDDKWISGCSKKAKYDGINCDRIDEKKVKKDHLTFKKKNRSRVVAKQIETSDADVDAEQQEFETDISLDGNSDLDDYKYDSEEVNAADKTKNVPKGIPVDEMKGTLKETKGKTRNMKAKIYMEKIKQDAEKWRFFKKKEAERKRDYRKRLSQKMKSDSTLFKKEKEKNRIRQQKLRQKRKANNQ